MELTCYAGSLECLKAALESGADSVYVGGESFGRDTLSQEFSREDLIEGIKFAHENNKKVYVPKKSIHIPKKGLLIFSVLMYNENKKEWYNR
mgnify:CR=1 FL=1